MKTTKFLSARKCLWMLLAASLSVTNPAHALTLLRQQGWLESVSAVWAPVSGAEAYHVYYSGEGISNQQADDCLVRQYAEGFRVDVPGLKAGSYTLTVVAVNGQGVELERATTEPLQVKAHNREGFAFTEDFVPGGYRMDGTPKDGARILYITAKTVNTVTCSVSDGKKDVEYTGLANILSAYGKGRDKTPLIIRVIGTVRATDYEGLKDGNYVNFEGSNASDRMLEHVTLEGIGDDATLYGYGICMKRTNGIEVRNVGIMLFGDDAISMDTDNYHNWIHNCDFFYGAPGSDDDQVKGDGSIDMKYRSTRTTIAYNHFFDSGKVMGCGGATKEETNLLITFHHNWFDHCDSRCPRLNHTTAHIYNNYYDGVAVYGIGCTEVSNAFIEGNHFRNVQRPMMIAGQGTDRVYASDPEKGTFSGQTGGMSKAYNNKVEGPVEVRLFYQSDDPVQFDAWLVESRDERVPETVSAYKGGYVYDNFDTADDFYTSMPDEPEQVADVVTTWAGRMDGGDLKWTFNNSVDDKDHDINTELKAAITGYQSQLLAIQGIEGGGGTEPEPEPEPEPTPTEVTQGGYIVDLINDPNSGFTIVGSTSNSKGVVTVDGTTYNTCLKMGSSSSVTFTVSAPMTMTLYFAASENKRISVTDIGELTIPATNIVTATLPKAGTYMIKRTNGESYLYYIALSKTTTTAVENVYSNSGSDLFEPQYYDLQGRSVSKPTQGIYIVKTGGRTYKQYIK